MKMINKSVFGLLVLGFFNIFGMEEPIRSNKNNEPSPISLADKVINPEISKLKEQLVDAILDETEINNAIEDINHIVKKGMSPEEKDMLLGIVLRTYYPSIFSRTILMLLEEGANPNTPFNGEFPLEALFYRYPDVSGSYLYLIKLLIDFGAQNLGSITISSPMNPYVAPETKRKIDAIMRLFSECKELLEDAEKNPTSKNLREAIIANQPFLVKNLIEKGFDVTPWYLDFAKVYNRKLISKLLSERLGNI